MLRYLLERELDSRLELELEFESNWQLKLKSTLKLSKQLEYGGGIIQFPLEISSVSVTHIDTLI